MASPRHPLAMLPSPQALAFPRLIMLDVDGTLFNTQSSLVHCFRKTFATLAPATAVPSEETVRAAIGSGAGLPETFVDHLHAPVGAEGVDEWVRTYRQIYSAEGAALTAPYPGALKVVRAAKARGAKIVIVTHKFRSAALAVLRRHPNLESDVDLLVADDGVVPRKPSAAIWDRFVAPRFERELDPPLRLGADVAVAEREVMMVGDTDVDVLFGLNIGAVGVWARWGYGSGAACEDADVVADSWWDLGRVLGLGNLDRQAAE